jgi:hypothetical protein
MTAELRAITSVDLDAADLVRKYILISSRIPDTAVDLLMKAQLTLILSIIAEYCSEFYRYARGEGELSALPDPELGVFEADEGHSELYCVLAEAELLYLKLRANVETKKTVGQAEGNVVGFFRR